MLFQLHILSHKILIHGFDRVCGTKASGHIASQSSSLGISKNQYFSLSLSCKTVSFCVMLTGLRDDYVVRKQCSGWICRSVSDKA